MEDSTENKISKRLKLKTFLKGDASILILGTLISQMIPFALQPILRRIYSPEEFGNFALFFSVYSIGAVLSTLNYHSAITLPKEDKKAKDLMNGIFFICTSMSLFMLLIVFVMKVIFAHDLLGLGQLVWLLPFSIFLNGCHLTFINWFVREKKFSFLSFNKIYRRVAEGTSQISLKYSSVNFGLVLGSIIGDLVNFLFYAAKFFKNKEKSALNFQEIKKVLVRYKNMPFQALIPNLLNTLAAYIPIFAITAFFSKEITGYFDLSRMVLAMPLALISTSISSVLLQRYSQLKNNNLSLMKVTLRYFKPLFFMSVIGLLIVFNFGSEVFSFVFGEKNEIAGKFASVMIFSYVITFLSSPFSTVFIALEKLKINSLWQIGRFLSLTTLFFIKFNSIEDFIFALTILESINYLIYFFLIYFVIKKHEKRLAN